MTSTLPPLVQAVSGAIGSASANVLTYPLDLTTTLVQLDPPSAGKKRRAGLRRALDILKGIIRRHGFSALYDGLPTDTGATILSNFLYFYFYSYLRSLSTRRRLLVREAKTGGLISKHKPSILEELLLGFLAGVASRAISTPLSMITLRLQAEGVSNEEDENERQTNHGISKRKGLVAAIQRIYREGGLIGFWRGFHTTLLLSMNPSITLTFFQIYRRLLSLGRYSRNTVDPSPTQAFFGAAISNSFAVTLLYPILLAKTRLQASSATSMRQVLIDAYNGEDTYSTSALKTGNAKPGSRGLYQGLETQILKGFLSQGVTFLIKGRIEQMIVNAYLRRRRYHM